jgi:hypothetical protein
VADDIVPSLHLAPFLLLGSVWQFDDGKELLFVDVLEGFAVSVCLQAKENKNKPDRQI